MSNETSKQAIYAILADSVYWDVRNRNLNPSNPLDDSNSNWTPVPSDWKLIAEMSGSGDVGRALNKDLEGFTARAYQNGNKIVIAYAGTHQPDFSGDWKNNAKLGVGVASEQAKLAAIFYQQIKQSNTLADIEFTGHSLGGGLAGMMGVWFNRPAYIFDHAPFVNAVIKEGDIKPSYREDPTVGDWLWDSLPEAVRSILSNEPEQLITSSTMKYARQVLMEKFGYIDNEFARYSAKDHLEQRTKNITAIATKGEFLDFVSFAGMHYKENDRVLDGETTLGKFDKHSQTLLVSALLDEDGFGKYATNIDNNGANIDTLSLIFDSNLYGYAQNSDKQNFLSKLVRSHIGASEQNGGLGGGTDYATGDVNKSGTKIQSGGYSLLTEFGQTLKLLAEKLKPYDMNSKYHKFAYDALIVHAIEWHYHQDMTQYNGRNFLTTSDHAVHFTSAYAEKLLGKQPSKTLDYNNKWVIEAHPYFSKDSNKINFNQYDQWTIALNGGQSHALDNNKTQILITLGHAHFEAGNKQDLLLGYDGNDTLKGGKETDKLFGGNGIDTYYIQDNDIILDTDMKGKIIFEKAFGGKDIQARKFAFVADNVWESTDEKGDKYGNMQANRLGNDLKIINGKHSVSITDFFSLSKKDADGHWQGLDITLKGEPINPFIKTGKYHDTNQVLRFTYDYVNTLPANASILKHEEARLGANPIIKQNGSHTEDLMFNTQNGSAIAFLGSGNDWAYGGYGYDWLYGEDGNDMLFGSALAALIARPSLYSQNGKEANVPTGLLDRDYIVGGAGSDLIFGVDGDDTIHTDQDRSQGSIAGYLIEQSAALSILRGDLAAGGKGNDHIFGSIARDLLTGGAGADRIFGGAGSDVLIGDGELFPNTPDSTRNFPTSATQITISKTNPIPPQTTTILRAQHLPFDSKTDKFTDEKHKYNQNAWDIRFDFKAGKYTYESVVGKRLNEHHVKEGAGNDSLWGGQGTDLLIGQYGNDYLDGGAGNDVLWGDDYENPTSYQNHHGQNHDTLIAGSGLDYLYGGYGYDKYLFKKADLNHVQYDKKFIKDTDHSGHIMMNGVTLHSVKWTADAYLPNTWVNKEKDWALKLEGNHLIFSSPNKTAFNSTITIQDFKNKAFGLDLFSENDLNELVRNVSSTSSETQDDTQTYTEYNTDSHINTSPHYLDTSNRYEII